MRLGLMWTSYQERMPSLARWSRNRQATRPPATIGPAPGSRAMATKLGKKSDPRAGRLGRDRRWRRRRERGSALMLVPAGFLVMVILGSIAVDSGAAYLAQRQLANALTAAADDAATAALANSSFYGTGALVIDPTKAATVVCKAVASQGDADLRNVRLSLAVAGAEIAVRAKASVPAVFGRLVPGLSTYPVEAVVRATATERSFHRFNFKPNSYVPISCVV